MTTTSTKTVKQPSLVLGPVGGEIFTLLPFLSLLSLVHVLEWHCLLFHIAMLSCFYIVLQIIINERDTYLLSFAIKLFSNKLTYI